MNPPKSLRSQEKEKPAQTVTYDKPNLNEGKIFLKHN